MEELNSLTELQIVKLYNKTNDQRYLDAISTRIEKLHESHIDPNNLSNEQLVLLCQKYGDEIYWDALYNKTKNSIHFCINKYANDFYKAEYNVSTDKENTDLFAAIRLGWYKAVNTYSIIKGNAGFIAYASTLMYQHYIKLTRQVNQKHNGVSVNAMYIESVHSKEANDGISTAAQTKVIDAINTDYETGYAMFDAKEFIKEKLNLLKEYDELMYDIVILHYFKDKTQVEIAKIYKRNKTWVSRQLRRAKQFLRARITDDDYLRLIKELDK